jgi:hypothetical protein
LDRRGVIKIRTSAVMIVVLLLLIGLQACAESTSSREYKLKAAYLYNFIRFVEWPKERMADANEPVIIGVIGKSPFGSAFEPIKDEKAKGRKVIIKWFKGLKELKEYDKAEMDQTIKDIRKCHLLFICSSEEKTLKEIMDWVKGYSVLTVAGMPDFLESGGMINLIVEEDKIRFEINNFTANQTKLKISSQLLKVAKRVVDEKEPSQEEKSK